MKVERIEYRYTKDEIVELVKKQHIANVGNAPIGMEWSITPSSYSDWRIEAIPTEQPAATTEETQ